MRTIIYIILAALVFGIFAEGYTGLVRKENKLTIQATDKSLPEESLSQSAAIISGRLKSFYGRAFRIEVNPAMKQVIIHAGEVKDAGMLAKLALQPGNMGFYETLDSAQVASVWKENSQLAAELKRPESGSRQAVIGCTPVADIQKTDLKSIRYAQVKSLLLGWKISDNGSEACLYGLVPGKNGVAQITGRDIQQMDITHDKNMTNPAIEITLKQPAIAVWTEMTSRNLGKEIAIVLDNQVLCSPMVRTVISGGKSMITGKFTETELKYIVAMGMNGVLPATFEIVK